MNRIKAKFEELRQRGEKALITFITAGDPCLSATMDLVLAMEDAGADIVELGIPYSDPLADGPIIQESSQRALKAGANIKNIMGLVQDIRKRSEIPLIYLVYYNSVFKYGVEKFFHEARDGGLDGIIIPDLPLEEREELYDLTEGYGISLIPLVAPTSKERIKEIVAGGSGFVYCVSSPGVTGIRQNIDTDVQSYMNLVSKYTKLPKALGFGISNADMVNEYKNYCDGIIVGSAIVKKIAECSQVCEAVEVAAVFAKELKSAFK
ncbi:tryptophan synthase subunit alpha [Clostridium thermarum]|uniref:tryptophan synthase subunit alpha n=1 Tax=Clostridium thermarum TaxID=1716543 RepID=UPI0013D28353